MYLGPEYDDPTTPQRDAVQRHKLGLRGYHEASDRWYQYQSGPDGTFGWEPTSQPPLMLTDDEVAALRLLLEKSEDLNDKGPPREGWQSDELVSALMRLREALTRA